MAERKVLNKYIPPNFDPNNQSTIKRGKVRQKKVRLMAPFSMQCNTCGEFIYKGKKFNARKERAIGEDFLGLQIFRFYIRCPVCASEIMFKTDLENTDYVCERGATRNYEPWRDETKAFQEMKEDREKTEEYNPMLALENRTLDSKREMDILDALDEIKTKNAQLQRADPDEIISKLYKGKGIEEQLDDILEEEDKQIVRSIFRDADGDYVKRLSDNSVLFQNPPVKNIAKKGKAPEKACGLNLGIKLTNCKVLDSKTKKAPNVFDNLTSSQPTNSLANAYGSSSDSDQ
jgi:hypothetical protein